MKEYNEMGVAPILSTERADSFVEKSIAQVYTEDGVKMVHLLGYGYNSESGHPREYRVLDYCFMTAPVADICADGGLSAWEQKNAEEYKQYTEDCTEQELIEAYQTCDEGKAPAGYLDERFLSEATPDGLYIVDPVEFSFEMFLRVQFDREIRVSDNGFFSEESDDYLSPGGFEMTMNGKSVPFDFSTNEGKVDRNDRRFVDFYLHDPDYWSFPKLLRVTESDLKNITHLSEVFVYTGENAEGDARVVKIEHISFRFPNGQCVRVSQPVLDEFNETRTD